MASYGNGKDQSFLTWF